MKFTFRNKCNTRAKNQIKVIVSKLLFREFLNYFCTWAMWSSTALDCSWTQTQRFYGYSDLERGIVCNNSVRVTSVIRQLPDEVASQYRLIWEIRDTQMQADTISKDKIIECRSENAWNFAEGKPEGRYPDVSRGFRENTVGTWENCFRRRST